MKSYDPSLRAAMAEIAEVLKKHDCGGFVSLASKTHGEFKWFLEEPSWSNVRFLKEGSAAHIKIHMKSSPENTEATAHMIFSGRDLCAEAFLQYDKMVNIIRQSVRVDHTPTMEAVKNDDRE